MRFRLVPTDDRFFDLFNEAATNVAECAKQLRHLIQDDNVAASNDGVVACERRGDELTQEILQRLNTSFVTPFDREDIHALAEELDDVVDDMYAVAARLRLTVHGPAFPELKEQAEILVKMADETVALVGRLASMKQTEPHLAGIDKMESEGDTVYRQALGRLFSG